MSVSRPWLVLFSAFLLSTDISAQLRHINPLKLPQDKPVQAAYSTVRSIEYMAHSWSPTWSYDTPKSQVASQLKASLTDLRSAVTASPQNEELALFTGTVAHLAYNLDVDDTYEIAVQSFNKATELDPSDYRAQWFLASHRCQSNEIKTGMEQMLAIEASKTWREFPVEFWDDYINCSTIALMPAHTLRAVDHAVRLGEDPSSYRSAVDIAHGRYKPTDANSTYSARDAWQATHLEQHVLFTSQLCGLRFSARSDWHLDIRDVAKGTCVLTVETGPYPSKSGQGTPTVLILTRAAKPEEQLDDFVRSFLTKFPSARSFAAPSCPSDKCIAFEIVTDTLYQPEGGAHLLVVGFAEPSPEFPGLLFEQPEGPPKSESSEKVAYYHPNEKLHRVPGTLYTVVELDSNVSIFEKAAEDFRYVLKSIQLD